MAIMFPVESYLPEGFDVFEGTQDEREKRMEDACAYIEKRLRDFRYLREFSWNGQQAFYNDQPQQHFGGQERESYAEQISTEHLIDAFHVDYGHGYFLITNHKEVSSRNGKWNLFEDLLYPGFREYHVPMLNPRGKYSNISAERINYESRTVKGREAFERKMLQGMLMTYYYRYDSHWCFRKRERKGMYPALVSKFHSYIDGAISWGVEQALKEEVGDDEEYEFAKELMEE